MQPLKFSNISLNVYGQQNAFTFELNNKVGFIDTVGKIIINPLYDNNSRFKEKDYLFYMDEEEWSQFNNFFDNICKVSLNFKLGVIDIKGNVIIPCEYQQINYEFYNAPKRTNEIEKIRTVDFRGKKKFFDKTGKEIKE